MSISQVYEQKQIENIVELFHFRYFGTDYYFTDHNIPITPDAGTPIYLPRYIERSEIVTDLTLEPQELVIGIESGKDEIFKKALLIKGLELWVYCAYLPDYPGDVFKAPDLQYYGSQANESMNNDKQMMEFIFLQGELRKNLKYLLSKTVQKQCNNILFDTHCGLTKTSYESLATVTGLDKTNIEAALFATKPDAYYYLGEAVLDKDGAEQRRMITAHTGDTIQINYAFLNLEVGDQLTVTPGCDKKAETCLNKYSNIYNFSGFPYMPEETT